MATSTQEWIDELKSISVLELSERIKALEEEFGVSATAVAAAAPAGGGGGGDGARGRGGADRVRRRPHRRRRQEDPGHQGRPRGDRPRPQGGQGARRRGARSPSRRASSATRPTSSRPSSRRPARPSRSSSPRTRAITGGPRGRPVAVPTGRPTGRPLSSRRGRCDGGRRRSRGPRGAVGRRAVVPVGGCAVVRRGSRGRSGRGLRGRFVGGRAVVSSGVARSFRRGSPVGSRGVDDPGPVAGGAARWPAGWPAGCPRSRSARWRLGALAAWLAVPTYPAYDSLYSLVWAREILDGALPSFDAYRAPTQHPLLLPVEPRARPAGRRRRAHVRRCCASRRCSRSSPRHGGSGGSPPARSARSPPPGCVGSRLDIPLLAALGYLDIPYCALVIWAIVLEAERPQRGRPVWILLALAGLLRPGGVAARRRLRRVARAGAAPLRPGRVRGAARPRWRRRCCGR